jgi:tRNA G18 (ribose-2'-O)-methylase SpoU
MKNRRGFYGVAVYHPKTAVNTGTLFRTAQIFDVDFCAIIGKRYKQQPADTMNASGHIPFFEYDTFDDFYSHMPYDCQLVGVELDEQAVLLENFKHPERALYLMGAEDHGIPPVILSRCHKVVQLRGERSMNVSVAGSLVIYDRTVKGAR